MCVITQVLDDLAEVMEGSEQIIQYLHMKRTDQMNEVMYMLTMVATIFIPGQFLSSVYGMNFDNMPELHSEWGYIGFWITIIVIELLLLVYFRWGRGWI